MMTKLDPITEALQRSTQFRGPVPHEEDVRRIAGDILAAFKAGQLTAHDLRTLADCLETAVRKAQPLRAV